MIELDDLVQRPLYDLAMEGLEQFVTKRGAFTPFAIVMLPEGELLVIETSGEFQDAHSACEALTSQAISMKRSRNIIGSLLCVPVEVPVAHLQAAAVMEVEAFGCPPVRVLRQIKQASGGATLSDDVSMMEGTARVF